MSCLFPTFNILKLGKFCYYLDATWGDASNTKDKNDETHNWVQYDYFCVPYDEFLRTEPSVRHDHIPEPKYYPDLETFKYTNHEYYRFHSYYMNSYNEGKFVDIIEKSVKDYDPKEMGDFVVAVRFASQATAKTALSIILANGTLAKLVDKAKSRLSKKAHKELLDRERITYSVGESGILSIRFKTPEKSRKKKNR